MSRWAVPRDNASDQEWRDFMRDIAGRFVIDQVTWDPGSISATTVAATTLTTTSYPSVKGLRTDMDIHVTPPSDLDDGLHLKHAYCATNDTLTIVLENTTGSPIDQGEGVWKFSGRMP